MKLITWNRKQPVLKSPCPLNNTPRNEHDRVRYFFDLTITSTMFFEFVAVWLCFNAQSVFFFIIFSMKRLRERQKEQGFVLVHIFRRSVWVWFFFFFYFFLGFYVSPVDDPKRLIPRESVDGVHGVIWSYFFLRRIRKRIYVHKCTLPARRVFLALQENWPENGGRKIKIIFPTPRQRLLPIRNTRRNDRRPPMRFRVIKIINFWTTTLPKCVYIKKKTTQHFNPGDTFR